MIQAVGQFPNKFLWNSYFSFLSDDDLKIEKFCNQFASEFLVPNDDFQKDIYLYNEEGLDAVSEIAQQYSVSREVILRKLMDHGIVSESLYRQKTKRNKNAGL